MIEALDRYYRLNKHKAILFFSDLDRSSSKQAPSSRGDANVCLANFRVLQILLLAYRCNGEFDLHRAWDRFVCHAYFQVPL